MTFGAVVVTTPSARPAVRTLILLRLVGCALTGQSGADRSLSRFGGHVVSRKYSPDVLLPYASPLLPLLCCGQGASSAVAVCLLGF